jgi:hypothetical protein
MRWIRAWVPFCLGFGRTWDGSISLWLGNFTGLAVVPRGEDNKGVFMVEMYAEVKCFNLFQVSIL